MARIKPIDKLTLKEMMLRFELYVGLPDGLSQLPCPEKIRINKIYFPVPANLDEFTENICYGQRIFFTCKEDNDFGLIIRMLDCYYYPIVTKKKWDEDKALLFGKKIITCTVEELYPVAMHLIKLISEMTDRE